MARPRRNPARSGAAPPSRQSATASGSRRKATAAKARDPVPDVFREMVAESQASTSRASQADGAEPAPKRLKRPGQKSQPIRQAESKAPLVETSTSFVDGAKNVDDEEDDDEDIVFEDIEIPAPVIQTVEMSEDDEDDDIFGELDLSAMDLESDPVDEKGGVMELNLSAFQKPTTPSKPERKKTITRAERDHRVEIHRMHLLCLLSHAARRNHWCNDSQVQKSLRPLLTDKMIKYLNPDSKLSQFGRTESLKNGVQQVSAMFQQKFRITERGIRRSLWAENEEHLKNYEMADDLDSVLDRDDFREAAKTLQGSRDVGAQLFCALLRAAGVETRLICSLQPLSFVPSAPTLAKPKKRLSKYAKAAIPDIYRTKPPEPEPVTASSSPMRRQGHHLPAAPFAAPTTSHYHQAPKPIRNESAYPVYWIEVLDVAHQKWAPVDPLVTSTQWKPARLEPPASDRSNSLAYAIAFSSSNTAKDVTRRYAKAYNSKTRRLRIDSLPAPPKPAPDVPPLTDLTGERWLRRALRLYRSPEHSDLDQIEDIELSKIESHEPMPRNVADFKGHPVFALERHLRRHEVIRPGAAAAGTVSAGSKAPLERIYRRRDVRICRTADKWYRMGRVVKPDEIPAKWLPRSARKRGSLGLDELPDEDEEDPVLGPGELNGTPIFTTEQTDEFVPPPVVDGVVPKNKFGNIDVYVPSMVPPGGVHIPNDRAARAAFLLGVDYAPALTGFDFTGPGGWSGGKKRGTAVLRGAVIPAENAEAVRVVIEALADVEAEMVAAAKSQAAMRMWVRFLRALRIRRRIRVAAEERGEIVEDDDDLDVVEDDHDGNKDVSGQGSDIYDDDDDGEGGFMVE